MWKSKAKAFSSMNVYYLQVAICAEKWRKAMIYYYSTTLSTL